MKNLIIITFSLSLMIAGTRGSSEVSVFSGESVIVLTAQKVQLDLNRRTDFGVNKDYDNSLQKRRHKRRRKIRPPKQGK